jgi:integrase
LPGERSKTGKEVVRPCKAAIDVLDELPNIADCPFFFSTDGRTSISSFSRWKKQLDERVLAELKKTDPKAKPLQPWVLHDLRRTSRSLLSRARVSPDHASHWLGHTIGGIRQVYDRYNFLPEKAEAFAALAKLVELIVTSSDESNVVQLRAGRNGTDAEA